MSINEIQNEIIEEFSVFDEWMDKYEYLIDLGKSVPILSEKHKNKQNLISGCQSKVWLNAKLNNGKISFEADSDAIITKGIVALLIRVFNNQTPEDILNTELYFIEKIGLQSNLSPTRANGLVAMIKQIKYYAMAYKAKMEN